jgi:hypothetical protein
VYGCSRSGETTSPAGGDPLVMMFRCWIDEIGSLIVKRVPSSLRRPAGSAALKTRPPPATSNAVVSAFELVYAKSV